jgi:hypothetical protein
LQALSIARKWRPVLDLDYFRLAPCAESKFLE